MTLDMVTESQLEKCGLKYVIGSPTGMVGEFTLYAGLLVPGQVACVKIFAFVIKHFSFWYSRVSIQNRL